MTKMALQVIEALASDDFCFDIEWDLANKRLRGKSRIMAEKLSAIYRYSHAVLRTHSCHHVHKGWRKQLKEAHAELAKTEPDRLGVGTRSEVSDGQNSVKEKVEQNDKL